MAKAKVSMPHPFTPRTKQPQPPTPTQRTRADLQTPRESGCFGRGPTKDILSQASSRRGYLMAVGELGHVCPGALHVLKSEATSGRGRVGDAFHAEGWVSW